MGSARYIYASILALVLASSIAAIAYATRGSSGAGLAGAVERYVESIVAADFQRSAVIGYLALQPSYPLESVLLDIASLYTNTLYVGGAGSTGVYLLHTIVSGHTPAGVQPAGAPLNLRPGSLFMMCSSKGNRLTTSETLRAVNITVSAGGRATYIARSLATLAPPAQLSATVLTRLEPKGSVLDVSSNVETRAAGARFTQHLAMVIDEASLRLISYTIKTRASSSGGQESEAYVSASLTPLPPTVSYKVTGLQGVFENTTRISETYWSQVLQNLWQVRRMVSVSAEKIGEFEGMPEYHVKIRISGQLALAGFKAKVDAIVEGDYLLLGSVLYPLKAELKSYEATLEGPGKTCRIILGGPASIQANVTLVATTGSP